MFNLINLQEIKVEKRHDIPVFSLGNLLPWYIYNMHEDMGFLWPSSAHTFAIDTHQLSKTINNLVLVERKKNKTKIELNKLKNLP